MLLIVTLIILFAVFSIYKNKTIKKGEKHNFEYLDTFFYQYMNNSNTNTIVFHVVSDIETNTIYAIPDASFNGAGRNINLGKLLNNKGSKKINYGDKGTFYLDKEFKKCYVNENGDISILGRKVIYNKLNSKNVMLIKAKEPYDIYNRNRDYDISLLDKAVFAYGGAKFDEE